MPGSNKRMLERQAALEMEVQARAKAMVDAQRMKAQDTVAAVALQGAQQAVGVVSVMNAKETRLRARESGRHRRMGL